MIISNVNVGCSTSLVLIIVVFGLFRVDGVDSVDNYQMHPLYNQKHPCFVCPRNSIISLNDECIKMENPTNCAVRMPMPIIRPCHQKHHRNQADPKISVHVVRGPQPGSLLVEGQHRVVVRVDYDEINEKNIQNNTTPGLQIKLQKSSMHKKGAYCRFTLHAVANNTEIRRKDSAISLEELHRKEIPSDNNVEKSIMLAEFHFRIGQGAHTSKFIQSGKNSMSWCDDEEVVKNIQEVALTGLVRRNPSVCGNPRTNCTFIKSECLHSSPSINLILNDDDGSSADLLELKWKIMIDYLPLMGEDYVYEGADLPEAEMLIDQIQTDTENVFSNDLTLPTFSQEIKAAGGRLLNRSFKLGLLDLVCPSFGFILNSSTNKCEREYKSNDINSTGGSIDTILFKDSVKTKPSSGDQRLNNLVPNENENTKKLEQSTIAIRSFIPKKTSSKSKNTFKTLIMVNPKQSIPSQLKRPGRHHLSYVVEGKHLEVQQQQKNRSSFINGLISNYINAEDGQSACVPNPCLAGGKCVAVSNDNRFKCRCPPTSRGKRCEFFQCPSFYCFNGGTCSVTANLTTSSSSIFPQLSCACPKDVRGARCQHILRRDDKTPIQSKKTHDLLPDKTLIEGEKSNCVLNPCRNGGRCANLQTSSPTSGSPFTCLCSKPYLGKQCDFISCSASASHRICSTATINGSHRAAANRVGKQRRLQCLIQTSTGKRFCQQPEGTFTSF